MNNPKEIILHCSATAEGKDYTVETIDKWHKQRGFKKIGYHYVIYRDGSVHKGRDEKETGAHTVNHNSKSIGICYIGGLAEDAKTPKDTRTNAQKESMYKLVDSLMKKYNISLKDVHGHYEFAAKACPSFKMEQFKQEFTKWKENNNGNTTSNVLITTTNGGDWKSKILSFIYKLIKLLFTK